MIKLIIFTFIFLLIFTNCLRSTDDKNKSFTFVQLCDIQLGFGGYKHDTQTFKQAVSQINKLKPAFVVICGDLVEKVNKKSFDDFLRIKKTFTVPCHCAPGNHDVGNKPTLKSLTYYRKTIGKDYYDFTHKGYSFVITNTSLIKSPIKSESKKQFDWLKKTLTKNNKKDISTFVIGHYPLYEKTPDEDNQLINLPKGKRMKLLNLYEKNSVIAVLSGHAHKRIITKYKNIQLVTGGATSRNIDKSPLGFLLWNVLSPKDIQHKFIPLESIPSNTIKTKE